MRGNEIRLEKIKFKKLNSILKTQRKNMGSHGSSTQGGQWIKSKHLGL